MRNDSDKIRVEWIKLSVDMFDNRKIRALRKLPAGNDILLIWIMLLTLAGKCNANGLIFLTENIPYNVKMLADELGFEESTVQLALEAFQNFGMIRTDGFISIEGWEEHQNADKLAEIREYNRIAKQKSRERQRQKQLQAVTNVNDMSSESQGFLLTSISTSISPSSDIEDNKEEGVIGGEEEEEEEIVEEVKPKPEKPKSEKIPEVFHKYGEYGWVKLTDRQYEKLLKDLGELELLRCIKYVDESAQGNSNKNKWTDWNLVVRRCSRERWGRNNSEYRKRSLTFMDVGR